MSTGRGGLAFAVFVFLLSLFFVLMSFDYEHNSRLIPLLVGLLTLALVFAVLIHEIRPFSILEKLNIDWTKELRVQESAFEKKDKDPARRIWIILFWMFGFFLLIFLFGFPISIALFTFVFLKIEAKAGWIRSSVMAGLSWAVVFVIFELAMGFELFEGVLFGEIIPPI
jgi:hypothetical protein